MSKASSAGKNATSDAALRAADEAGGADAPVAEPLRDSSLRFWDLQFRDRALERDYRRSYFDNDIKRTRIGLICGALVLLVFAIVEPLLLELPALVGQVRLLFVMPLILLCLIASYTHRTYLHLLIVGGSMLATSSQILLLPVLGPEMVTNVTMAYLQHMMFIIVLLFQPFRYLVVPAVLLAVLMDYTLRAVAGTGALVINYQMAIQGISFIALLFAYVREQSQRHLFAADREVQALRNETERQQTSHINWLSNLSRYLEHELRDHVFIVESNLENLQGDVRSDYQQSVQRAMSSVVKLNELCDSVGEASKLESALQLDQLHPLNFSQMLIDRVLERSRDIEEANPLELDVDPDLWVLGSELRLLQVFDNLLNNALEYSSENAFVRLELKSVAGTVYFTVHNRGEPLPEDRNIFSPFESSRPNPSHGMGLYVARKIIDHHHGSIEAQNQLGQIIVIARLPQVAAPVGPLEDAGPDGAIKDGAIKDGAAKKAGRVVYFDSLRRKP